MHCVPYNQNLAPPGNRDSAPHDGAYDCELVPWICCEFEHFVRDFPLPLFPPILFRALSFHPFSAVLCTPLLSLFFPSPSLHSSSLLLVPSQKSEICNMWLSCWFCSDLRFLLFTAWRYASAVLGVVILSVRPSVCLSQPCFVTNPKPRTYRRWSAYVTSKSPKGLLKKRTFPFFWIKVDFNCMKSAT